MSVSVTVRPGDSYSSPGWMSSKYRRRSAMENQRIAQGRGVAGAPGGLTPAESRPRVRPAKGDAYERQPQREPPTLPQDDSHGGGRRHPGRQHRDPGAGERRAEEAAGPPVGPLRPRLRRVVQQTDRKSVV